MFETLARDDGQSSHLPWALCPLAARSERPHPQGQPAPQVGRGVDFWRISGASERSKWACAKSRAPASVCGTEGQEVRNPLGRATRLGRWRLSSVAQRSRRGPAVPPCAHPADVCEAHRYDSRSLPAAGRSELLTLGKDLVTERLERLGCAVAREQTARRRAPGPNREGPVVGSLRLDTAHWWISVLDEATATTGAAPFRDARPAPRRLRARALRRAQGQTGWTPGRP